MEETDLIKSAQKGDRAAIARLLLAYRDLVANVVNRMVYDPDARKDVIQSIFLKAAVSIGSFRESCKFSTWLYRLSLNESVEQNRRKIRWSRIRESLVDNQPLFQIPDDSDGFESLSRKEIVHAINGALKDISLDKKTAFFLFYIAGYSGRDAAAQMKITEENFFMKLKAARDLVKKALIDHGWKYGRQ